VHEEGYTVFSDAGGQIVFFTPKGRAFAEVPQMPELPDLPEVPPNPFAALVRRNRGRGIMPDCWSGMPVWKRDGDIPWKTEAAALEAILSSGESDGVEPEDANGESHNGESHNGENDKRENDGGETDDLVENAA
jgi:hypothetical protein